MACMSSDQLTEVLHVGMHAILHLMHPFLPLLWNFIHFPFYYVFVFLYICPFGPISILFPFRFSLFERVLRETVSRVKMHAYDTRVWIGLCRSHSVLTGGTIDVYRMRPPPLTQCVMWVCI